MNRTVAIALFLVGGLAQAQPVDDPGLAQPQAPAAAPAPAPTPAPTPAPAPAAAPKPASRAVTMTPMTEHPAAPEVSERLEVKTDWVAPDREIVDIYERVAAPTLSGGTGLFRTQSADIGAAGTFRVGLHAGVFSQSSLVISGANAIPGDTNTHFTGDLTISYTPWKYIEAYVGLYNTSNQNERTDPGRTDEKLLLSLGDFALGAKGRYPAAQGIDVAVRAEVKFLDSINAASIASTATNVTADAIASFDLRRIPRIRPVPLRFHVNAGYLYDNSIALLPTGQCATSTGNDPCIRSRAVETFAYGIGSSRVRTAFAVDSPLQAKTVGIQPFVEYHLEIAVGDGDQTLLHALKSSTIGDRLSSPVIQYLTAGLRVRPIAGLILDAGIDIGLASPGFQYGPPVPAYNVLLGAAYAYDGRGRKTKVVARTLTREVARAPVEGKLRGIVRDATTKKPLEGAVVKYVKPVVTAQSTGQDGTFVSYKFAPGPVTVEISRDDYEPLKSDAEVVANGETAVEALLVPKPPAAGTVRVRVSDPDGPLMAANVRLVGPGGKIIDADAEGAGAFAAKALPGDWSVEVIADGHLGRERGVVVAAGQSQSVEVTLPKKPVVSHVKLEPTEIVVKGTIHFSTSSSDVLPDGAQLVDEVADVLVRNPQIRKLRVEGHTDNRGLPEKNLALSQQRAAAVVAYLIKQGIDPARLDSQGYGGTQPLVPNLTPANRTRNRRVTFRIVDSTP